MSVDPKNLLLHGIYVDTMTLALLNAQRLFLLRMGEMHLGPPDVTARATLDAFEDTDDLEKVALAIATAKSWDELLAAAGPPPPLTTP
jgi:hypothetical protein